MRSTEARLAKVEKALLHMAGQKDGEAFQAKIAELRAAKGPVSFVCGDTEVEAWERVEALRELGMIQHIDRVHVLPTYPEFGGKHFTRIELLGEHSPAIIRHIRDYRHEPGRAPPPGWRTLKPPIRQEA